MARYEIAAESTGVGIEWEINVNIDSRWFVSKQLAAPPSLQFCQTTPSFNDVKIFFRGYAALDTRILPH